MTKMSLSSHMEEKIEVMVKGEGNHQYITHFFVSKDDASIYEEGCLKREASKVVIVLKVYMVPLDNKCCAYKPHWNRGNAMRKIYQSILVRAFTKIWFYPSNLVAVLLQFYIVNWNSVTEIALGIFFLF